MKLMTKSIIGFPLLIKPILPLWPLFSEFFPNRIAYATITTTLPSSISICRKFVSLFTVFFSGIYSCGAITSKYIFSIGNQLKMRWITVSWIIAFMVKLNKSRYWNPFWNWLNKIGIQYTVNPFHCIPKPNISISPSIDKTIPVPTFSYWINGNSTKNSSELSVGKFVNYEIFLISHVRDLLIRLRMWLGPEWCVNTISARLL